MKTSQSIAWQINFCSPSNMRIINIMLSANAALPLNTEVTLIKTGHISEIIIEQIVQQLDLIRVDEDYSAYESMSDYDYDLFFGNFEPIQFE